MLYLIKNERPYVIVCIVSSVLLSMSLLTTVALTNLAVLALVIAAPFAWEEFIKTNSLSKQEKVFLGLIGLICVWDIFTNIYSGHSFVDALKAMLHDMRTLGFIAVLWAIFSNVKVSKFALYSLLMSVVSLATANLVLTLIGHIPQGNYFWPSAPHLYGQVLIGLFFVLAQMWLLKPSLSWRVAIPMLLLVSSLFLASERRTGYLLLAAAAAVWLGLNFKRVFAGRYKLWVVVGVALACTIAINSDVVQRRMILAVTEVNQYLSLSPEEKAGVATSVGIRMQFYASIITLIKQSNWLIGVGSLDFPSAFYAINQQLGTTAEQARAQFSDFQNPHNEYLFMLATKGVIGLFLYVAIFVQACRLAWEKTDDVQRNSLLVMVFIFMVSITTNSMMTDMEEGHFTMLMLLIFLAPSALNLAEQKPSDN